MDVGSYLARIGAPAREPPAPTAATLRKLHRAHMLHVPFESYDCALGRPVTVEVADNFRKIVERGRGGFCFELNGLFAWLLHELGFSVTLLSARPFVVGKEAEAAPEFAHLTLLVDIDRTRWLADVGFGDGFLEPLRLDMAEDQVGELGRAYRIEPGTAERQGRQVHLYGGDEAEGYLFTLEPRRLEDFEGMCEFYSTSPDSSFVRAPVCSVATAAGRVTIAGRRRLIVTENGRRTERLLADDAEERAVLANVFGVFLDRE